MTNIIYISLIIIEIYKDNMKILILISKKDKVMMIIKENDDKINNLNEFYVFLSLF